MSRGRGRGSSSGGRGRGRGSSSGGRGGGRDGDPMGFGADPGFGFGCGSSPAPLGTAPADLPGAPGGTSFFGTEDRSGLAQGDVPARALQLYMGLPDPGDAPIGPDGKPGTAAKQKGKKRSTAGAFETLGLSELTVRAIAKKGYRQPTPIQRRAIPRALEGRDIVAMARTGSGKSAAFLLPMVEKLGAHSTTVGVRGLVLTPTRELALQTLRFFKEFARFTDLRVVCIVGGESIDSQFADLTTNPDVIIATPGRLLHLTVEVADFTLASCSMLVLDEADRLFELGLAGQIDALLSQMQDRRQTLLFSATMPAIVADFVRAGLREPLVVRLDAESKISDDLGLAFFLVRPDEKFGALCVRGGFFFLLFLLCFLY
jgi:hypothetical protein